MYGHLPACMSAPLAHLLPMEARRENRIVQDWSYRWLWATTWILETKHKSSGRAANALNYWTIKIGIYLFNLCMCLFLDGARVMCNVWSTCTRMYLSMQKSRRCFYLPLLPSVYYLGWGFLLNPKLTILVKLVGQQTQNNPSTFNPQMLGLQALMAMPNFSMGAGNLNSCSFLPLKQVFLLNEPCPQTH